MIPKLLALFALTLSLGAAEPRDISAALEAVRAQYKVPAGASAVIEDGRITAIGATGTRRVDSTVPVTTADIWHIGSCTKSMTAALVGIFVDAGKLRWDMSVPEALPRVRCDEGWRQVTLWHLVTQRSGIAPLTSQNRLALAAINGSPRVQRDLFARATLARAPVEPPGRFAYSNSGYGLLGAILEHAAGEGVTYEDLLRQFIFAPLDLKTAGFGPPATPGKLDQPWGHSFAGESPVPIEPLATNSFPLVLAPAGCVHMSLPDFARYAMWLSNNEPPLLKAETFTKLQSPPEGSTYAGGLWKSEFPGIGGEALCHTGRMGGFSAVFYAGPKRACVSVYTIGDGGWEWFGDVLSAAALKAAR